MKRRSDLPREFPLTIERLSHEGRGVGHHEGKTVFVADALPGEAVTARVVRRHRRFDEAVTLEVRSANPERVLPRCPHAAGCGGCSLQHLAPAAQLAHKQSVLLELLRHQGNSRPQKMLAPIAGPLWGYRRRARLSVRMVYKKDRLLVGFREKSSHFVAEITQCAVLDPRVGERIELIRQLVESLEIRAQIPQIEVAADDRTVLLALRVMAPPTTADLERLRAFEKSSGFRLALQTGDAASLEPIGEPAGLDYRLGPIRFEFRPGDFVQVNAEMNAALVSQGVALLEPGPEDRILDLFCGLGNFTLPLAHAGAGAVTGIDGDEALVERARANALANGLINVSFERADLLTEAGAEKLKHRQFDKVLLDPPRSGAEEVLKVIDLSATRRLVYVSCNPVTLARDTAILTRDRGFALKAAGVVDMFPHTAHVESVAVFEPAR